jgi:hypothetical protein
VLSLEVKPLGIYIYVEPTNTQTLSPFIWTETVSYYVRFKITKPTKHIHGGAWALLNLVVCVYKDGELEKQEERNKKSEE